MKLIHKYLSFALISSLLFYGLIAAKQTYKTQQKSAHKTGAKVQPTSKASNFTGKKIVLQLYQLMKDVHEVLLANNIEYWVIGGTLLGAVRHKGLIPWDDDLDICINNNQFNDFVSLKPIFKQLGYTLTHLGGIHDLYRIFPRNGRIIRGDKNSKIPFMDVFSYKQNGNNIIYSWTSFAQPRKDKNVAIYANELYPIRDYVFGNFFVKGPNDPFKYLACCYGSDFLEVAYCGHNHFGRKTKVQMIKLSEKDKFPAEPTGPLQDNVLKMLSNSQHSIETSVETVKISKNNLGKSKLILKSLLPIFVEAFEKQAEAQLKEEHLEEYEALKKSGLTIRDVLSSRFNKISETIISQIGSVDGPYISILKNNTDDQIGYAIFTHSPINKILQSMVSREYIKSIISLPEDILNSKASTNSDLYIMSIAVLPSFQKQGLGKRLTFSILSQFSQPKNIYLLAAESKTNIDAQKFYEHLKFERKGLFLTADNNLKILYCRNKELAPCSRP